MKHLLLFFFSCISLLSFSEEIKLSTVSLEVPNKVTQGNKTSVTNDGVSTYSFTRLRADSTAYVYYYSFKYGKALYEFRETCKADIWEWLESSYNPKTARKKEFKMVLSLKAKDQEDSMMQSESEEYL